jgi:hypothetical protein
MFLNDFDLDLGFLRGTPLTVGEGALIQVFKTLISKLGRITNV